MNLGIPMQLKKIFYYPAMAKNSKIVSFIIFKQNSKNCIYLEI